MALLDLQAMDSPIVDMANGSSSSGASCGSDVSLLLCGGGHGSEASVTLCGGH
jgi:hypothetical protein